jgi:hypothetical protein
MDTVYVSALAALGGSAIGALASIGTSWLTQRYQNQSQRAAEKSARLEQIFGEFIDQGDGKYSALPMSTIVAKEGTGDQSYCQLNPLRGIMAY